MTDLREYPKVNLDRPSEVTLGDLHGNALKFIHALLAEGVLVLDTPSDYKMIFEIYMAKNLNEYHIELFKQILEKAKVNPDVKLLRLIGDELCDRGRNDILMLYAFNKIFPKLEKNGANIEILLSNHGAEFINIHMKKNRQAPFTPTFIDKHQQRSYFKYKKTLAYLNSVDPKYRREIRHILKHNYSSHIKLISYQVIDPTQICLYTHAPVGLETIKMLAKLYGVDYQDDTIPDLCKTIDSINKMFRCEDVQHHHPEIERLIWTRGATDRLRDLPIVHKGYMIYLAHGHEGQTSTTDPFVSHQSNMFNLDGSNVGKTDKDLVGLHMSICSTSSIPEKKKTADSRQTEKAKKSAKVTPLKEKKHEVKSAPQDPVANLIAFIAEYEEKQRQAICFWPSKQVGELAAAKKLLTYLNQTKGQMPTRFKDIVTDFTSEEIKYLNDKTTPLGSIVRQICRITSLPIYTASVILGPTKKS
ncbi:MAG: hypothetical protein ACYCQI_10130 [Gammaproteobacteria bacterium]